MVDMNNPRKDRDDLIRENKKAKQEERLKEGARAGLVGIICNLILAGGKLLAGIMVASVSITADALNNFSDAVSSIVTMIGFWLAKKPADEEHPYGHARYEYLSGLAVAALIIVIGVELAQSSIGKIIKPTPVELTPLAGGILLVSIVVKFLMFLFYHRTGKKIESTTLLAAAADSRNDVITTSAVLLAGVVELLLQIKVDGYMGLAVAVFILISGVTLAKETISPLLGENANPELKEMIEDYILASEKVLGCHDLMVHDYGPGQRFASLHVEMDRREDPMVCHELIDDMERECYESHGVHLVIHYDPVVTDDPDLSYLKGVVKTWLKEKNEEISIHDFRMVKGEEHTNLIFDICIPHKMNGCEEQIRKELKQYMDSLGREQFFLVITFDRI